MLTLPNFTFSLSWPSSMHLMESVMALLSFCYLGMCPCFLLLHRHQPRQWENTWEMSGPTAILQTGMLPSSRAVSWRCSNWSSPLVFPLQMRPDSCQSWVTGRPKAFFSVLNYNQCLYDDHVITTIFVLCELSSFVLNKRRDKAQLMRDTSDNKKKLIRELNTLRCHSLLRHKRFGHSPSSVCRNMRVAPYKSLTEKCARKARAQEKNNQSACTWNEST